MNAPGEVKPEAEREEASEDQIEEEAEDPVTVYENYKCVQSFFFSFLFFWIVKSKLCRPKYVRADAQPHPDAVVRVLLSYIQKMKLSESPVTSFFSCHFEVCRWKAAASRASARQTPRP